MKKILMLLALAGLTSAAWAQNSTSEVVEYEVIQVQDKYKVITIQPEVLANVLVRH